MESMISTTFIKKPPISSRAEEALNEARNILMNRLFLGNYDERRYVDRLKNYRDVVTINPAETELIGDLEKIKYLLIKYCDVKWVGITGPNYKETLSGSCVWVRLSNSPFGCFWFQIKEIKYEQEEIMLKLKCIRSVRPQDFEDSMKSRNRMIEREATNKKNEQSSHYLFDFDSGKKMSILYLCFNDAVQQIQLHLTWRNFVLVGKFIAVITFMLVTAAVSCICYMGNYVLRLIRELTLLLHVLSPILIHVIDCLTKIIGGFFILIALIFKNYTNHEQPLQNKLHSQQNKLQSQQNERMLSIKTPPPILTSDSRFRQLEKT